MALLQLVDEGRIDVQAPGTFFRCSNLGYKVLAEVLRAGRIMVRLRDHARGRGRPESDLSRRGMVGYCSGMIGDVDSGIGVVALVRGPGAPNVIARTTLDDILSPWEGTAFAFPALDDTVAIDDAGAYVGGYVAVEGCGGPKRMRIEPHGAGLTLVASGVAARLRSFEPSVFLTDAAPLTRFPLWFHRDDEGWSATYGDTFYVRDSRAAPEAVDHPAEWGAFPGHYRSHNP